MEKRHIELTPAERSHLLELVKGTQPVKTYRRAKGLLAMDEGKTLQAVSEQVGVSYQTVSKWRNAFLSERLVMLFANRLSQGAYPVAACRRAWKVARPQNCHATCSPFGNLPLLAALPLEESCLHPWPRALGPADKSSPVECLY